MNTIATSLQGAAPHLQARWLDACLAYPARVLLFGVLALVPLAAGLSGIQKDPSVDAFVPTDHPAAQARERAREWFGLDDPMVVALVADDGQGAFTPQRLTVLRELHAQIELLPGVRRDDVVSLANRKAIAGIDGDLEVDPVIEPGELDAAAADLAWRRFMAMPMLVGLLGAADGSTVLLLAGVDDPNRSEGVYRALTDLARRHAAPGFSIEVAGVAAMNARLARTVDGDTRLFVPAALVTVLLLLRVALGRTRLVLGPAVVIAGSVLVTMGVLGASGASYYLITSALPVVIMALAVADGLHLMLYYQRFRQDDATLDARQALRCALARTRRPIGFTSLTTAAGFVGLSALADMQPIREFGLFACVGVLAAWLLTLTVLPAIVVLTDTRPAKPGGRPAEAPCAGVAAGIGWLTRLGQRRPLACLAGLGLVVCALAVLAVQARFDYERKRYFQPADPVRVADQRIGQALGGVNFLDVMVTAPAPGGIMTADALRALAQLRIRLAQLPGVVRAGGIDQSIALMHETLTGSEPGALPGLDPAPAQYMFLYEASSDPEDFRQEIDYDHQRTRVRAQLASDRYSLNAPVVEAATALVANWSAANGLVAEVGGRVAVNHGWMGLLASRHLLGLALAAVLVLLATIAALRAVAPALLAMVPVVVGVLSVYAVMGALSVDIAPATSMSAAIATGLGVDFGIHLVNHLRARLREGATVAEALAGRYLLVARACFWSAVALGIALAVICLSGAPPLRWFGVLVSAGAIGSLFGALLVLPVVLTLVARHFPGSLRHA